MNMLLENEFYELDTESNDEEDVLPVEVIEQLKDIVTKSINQENMTIREYTMLNYYVRHRYTKKELTEVLDLENKLLNKKN